MNSRLKKAYDRYAATSIIVREDVLNTKEN